MSNSETQVCRDYERMIITRGSDPLNALIPRDHNVNWDDQPSRFKVYFDVPRLPLPDHLSTELGTLAETVVRAQNQMPPLLDLSVEQLSTLLRLSNGILQRKLEINWNLDHTGRATHHNAVYARPSASGGGMYPFELYLVTGRGRSLMPGVYHYDNAHHALEQLLTGDVSHRIRAAVYDHPAANGAAYFVLISLNFWKNYFKYHNFCYHVVTQDVGAELGAIRTVALGLNTEPTFLLWFKDEILNRVLGIETETESVFAVVALGGNQKADLIGGNSAEASAVQEMPEWYDIPLTLKSSFQRSKHIFKLPLVESVHHSALLTGEMLPSTSELVAAQCTELSPDGAGMPLPPPTPELLDKGLLEVFMRRSSSWGRMTSHPRMEYRQLATMLRHVTEGQRYLCDTKSDSMQPRFTRLILFVNHVQDVPAGIYSHDADNDCLRTIREGDIAIELQRRYFLENYNLEQAACVVAIVGRVEGMLQVFGNRGLRILNAEVGIVAQSLYMATAAMSIGCGAVLGFDNIALNHLLGLEGSDQTSLLLLLIGPQREEQGRFDYRLI